MHGVKQLEFEKTKLKDVRRRKACLRERLKSNQYPKEAISPLSSSSSSSGCANILLSLSTHTQNCYSCMGPCPCTIHAANRSTYPTTKRFIRVRGGCF